MITPLRSDPIRSLGLALVLACALIVDLISGDSIHYVDERDYEQAARSLLHNQTFASTDGNPTAERPPGYPAFIAAAYAVDERPLAAKFANGLVLTLAAFALGRAAGRMHPRAGTITPFLIFAYPLLIYAASVLYPQVLGCLLLTITVLLISGDRLSSRQAMAAGLAYGVLSLAIPYFIMLLPLLAAFVLLRGDRGRWATVYLPAIFAGATALVVIPWTVRNYLHFHELIPVSTNSGKNLFIGNSPATTPNSGVTADVVPLCKRLKPGMDEYQFDSAMGKCALDWIKQDPLSAGRLYVGKVLNYFNFRNEIATKNVEVWWGDWLMFVTYYPLLLIAVGRAALFRRYPFGRTESLIYLLYFLNAFISAIYFTRIRFRIPFDFLLIAVVAAFVCRHWDARRAEAGRAPSTASPT